jgi:hypothetical protein
MAVLQRFACELMEPLATELGWAPKAAEPHASSLLRTLLLAQLASNKHEPTVNEAIRRFDLISAKVARAPAGAVADDLGIESIVTPDLLQVSGRTSVVIDLNPYIH